MGGANHEVTAVSIYFCILFLSPKMRKLILLPYLDGCWSLVYLRGIIYKHLRVWPLDFKLLRGVGMLSP